MRRHLAAGGKIDWQLTSSRDECLFGDEKLPGHL